MNPPQLPTPSPEAIAHYQSLLAEAIASLPKTSVVSLARDTGDEEPISLHQGAVFLSGLSAPALAEPAALAAFIAALRATYRLPILTQAQAVVFVDFATHINEFTAAELQALPVTVYPDGGLWTVVGGYPALWLGGPWRLHVGEATHEAPSLEAALSLAACLRKGDNA